jgi:serine/threonine protein kinase
MIGKTLNHFKVLDRLGKGGMGEVYIAEDSKLKRRVALERAYKQRDGGLSAMKGDPLLRNLHGDPRCPAFLKKMRLRLD